MKLALHKGGLGLALMALSTQVDAVKYQSDLSEIGYAHQQAMQLSQADAEKDAGDKFTKQLAKFGKIAAKKMGPAIEKLQKFAGP